MKTKNEYSRYKESARRLARERVAHFNKFYNFRFERIFIRNQKTRWGSCSGDGNLNFNYRIALLPSRLADYIIVHEMCHLWEFNHSRAFWDLMSRTIPECRNLRRELRDWTIAQSNL